MAVTGWPQNWKTWKTQGNLNFCRKNLGNSGKIKLCDMIANKNAFHRMFLSCVAQRKILKCPGNLREKLKEFCFSKMWSPCVRLLQYPQAVVPLYMRPFLWHFFQTFLAQFQGLRKWPCHAFLKIKISYSNDPKLPFSWVFISSFFIQIKEDRPPSDILARRMANSSSI